MPWLNISQPLMEPDNSEIDRPSQIILDFGHQPKCKDDFNATAFVTGAGLSVAGICIHPVHKQGVGAERGANARRDFREFAFDQLHDLLLNESVARNHPEVPCMVRLI